MARSDQAHIIFQCCEGGVNERVTLSIGTYLHFRKGYCTLTGQTILQGDQCVELETGVNVVDGSDTTLISTKALDCIEKVRGQLRMKAQFERTAPLQEQFPHMYTTLKPKPILPKAQDVPDEDPFITGEEVSLADLDKVFGPLPSPEELLAQDTDVEDTIITDSQREEEAE